MPEPKGVCSRTVHRHDSIVPHKLSATAWTSARPAQDPTDRHFTVERGNLPGSMLVLTDYVGLTGLGELLSQQYIQAFQQTLRQMPKEI